AAILTRRATENRLLSARARLGTGGPDDTLRDALRRTLGDPTLEIVYPRFGRGSWLNDVGDEVVVSEPVAGRALTPIDRDGKPIAGLMHDRSLLRRPRRLQAAVDAASFAIDNEWHKAELRAQLLDVEASRARILDAGERELRRLERNLHDGAQQRL